MPRISRSVTGGSAIADRVLALLSAFRAGDTELGLAELAMRTDLYKSTALRLLHSLEGAHYLIRTPQGTYRLAAEVPRLNAVHEAADGLQAAVMPILRSLVAVTHETAALHVRQGNHRVRLFWIDSPQPLREHVMLGEELPLDRGAGGLILGAYSGARGAGPDKIRKQGYATSIGGRLPELSGISAPVFNSRGELAGALTLTMPTQRWKLSWRQIVVAKAKELTEDLGGTVVVGERVKKHR
ncbi:helix-turn-helix domain-containing protein [Tunturibacter gelidoferens]|uniref:Helix-turn-helix domain-containing protein n=1 Tax=Tunturiibacter gelidiferens TaxID=3069689 RepID=A0AAU7Z4E8_9BACT